MSPAVILAWWMGLSAPSPASDPSPADDPTQQPLLAWSGPAGCPAHDQVLAEVDGLLDHPLTRSTTDYRFELVIVKGEREYEAKLTLSLARGQTTRELAHDDCDRLTRGIALVIALAVTEQRAAKEQAVEPAPSAPPGPDGPEPSPAAAPTPASEAPDTAIDPRVDLAADDASARPRARVRALLHPRAALATGALPRFGLDLDLGVGLALDAGHLMLSGSYAVPRAVAFEDGGAGRFQRWSLLLRGGHTWTWKRMGVRLEAGIEAGQILAAATGLLDAAAVRATWTALLVMPGISLRLAPNIRAVLSADLPFALNRPGFTVDGMTVVHRPTLVGIRTFFGVEFVLARMKSTSAGHP